MVDSEYWLGWRAPGDCPSLKGTKMVPVARGCLCNLCQMPETHRVPGGPSKSKYVGLPLDQGS